mgnify:CR=1 FL=1
MRALILSLLLAIAALATLSGCEKPDYQHPLHRK